MSTESWKVVPCPIHHGKHPCHDARWVMTADAEVEMSDHVPDDWRLASGSIVCQMRDGDPRNAHLVAAAPELLEALENLRGSIRHRVTCRAPQAFPCSCDADQLWEMSGAVIAKARASR